MKKLMLISALALTVFSLTVFSLAGCSSNAIETTTTPFPEFSATDMTGEAISDGIFGEYDATVVNFWNNGCGSCIEEMPELEAYYQEFKEQNINLIGVGTDSCDSEESLALAKEILSEKGVTYQNIVPDVDSTFYKEFIAEIMSYPTTYVVDREGNIIGAPITGVVKNQDDLLRERLKLATEAS